MNRWGLLAGAIVTEVTGTLALRGALDRARLLADITMVLSDAHVNILSANLSTTRNRVAKSRFTFEMAEAKHLDNVLKAVRSVPGVFDAYRVTQ